ncbi:uncharacterized protein L201_001679 [Kwoniella dendrophila CBS 6074]|uniref:Nudix hydrolase domain-containing protein n=1 Tax=Kwoniella dendrophila CBS 6074 TaxID=1295534 RepID=A0AAX4JMZ8_9TREE
MPPNIESVLPPLKPESLQCIYRLQRYVPPKDERRYPKRRSAAVAVVLFVGRLGDLYVLLSTRAGDMRTYAHDTALPGGKYEEGDIHAEGTARREAFEEIGLPMDTDKVRKLCELEKFLTGNSLIVTPVVFVITDHTLTPLINPSEVKRLFSMPLNSFLHSKPSKIPSFHYRISHRINTIPSWVIDSIPPPPSISYANSKTVNTKTSDNNDEKCNQDEEEAEEDDDEQEKEEIKNRSKFYNYRDVNWGNGPVRFHRFLTGREIQGVKPVYGLTAAILIQSAMLGYDQKPDFPIHAPGQESMKDRILYDVGHGQGPLKRAIDIEGLWDDWKLDEADGMEMKQFKDNAKAKL